MIVNDIRNLLLSFVLVLLVIVADWIIPTIEKKVFSTFVELKRKNKKNIRAHNDSHIHSFSSYESELYFCNKGGKVTITWGGSIVRVGFCNDSWLIGNGKFAILS